MSLKNKKSLVSRTVGVGKKRIKFVQSRIEEIKEAITKQDIRDLIKDKAILIKESFGKKSLRKNARKSTGNIKKKVNVRKKTYIVLVRKLRKYLAEMKKQEKVSREEVNNLRKKIRNREFSSLNSMKHYIKGEEK